MAYPSDADMIKLLTNDPIKNAEDFTGKKTDDDPATVNLGFIMHVHDNMVKDKALKAIGDTVFKMDWLAYCEMIETFGFGLMMEDFSPNGGESTRIYYHEKDGILLSADSFRGSRNSARVYYNWIPNVAPKEDWIDPNTAEFVNYWEAISSGGFFYPGHKRHEIPENVLDPAWDNIVWAGEHAAEEAIGFHLRRLREYGTFIPIWKEQPHLWLLGNWEKEQKDNYEQIRLNRIAKLPQWVRDNIKGHNG